jgi:hypothetical protein
VSHRLCPICQCLVETHAPGNSYIKIDGVLYHPACHARAAAEAASETSRILASRKRAACGEDDSQ